MTRRGLVLLAIILGTITGAALAATRDRGEDAGPSAPRAPSTSIAGPPEPERGRLPDGRLDPGFAHGRVVPGTRRVELRVPDPAGGPDWAVRMYDYDRYTLQRPARTLRGARHIGRSRCIQLGRIVGGRFGWVFPDGRFRGVGRIEGDGRLIHCGHRLRPVTELELQGVLRFPSPTAPEIERSVIWGRVPAGTAAVRVLGAGAADGPARVSRRGAVLHLVGPDARVARTHLTIEDAAGAEHRYRFVRGFRRGGHGPLLRSPTPIPGTERVEARVPDPAGGPGHGVLVAETREGRPCVVGAGQVAGDRLGGVDAIFGLFHESAPSPGRCESRSPTRDHPCSVSWGYGGGYDEAEDALLRRARVERRLQPGRSTVLAQCAPDVEQVTLRSPRDIRTLVPSPVGHVIYAIYDGQFPGGELVLTARLKGGRTWEERFPIGM